MAEAIMKDLLAKKGYNLSEFTIRSAGIAAIERDLASNHAVVILAEKGIDLSRHRAKRIDRSLLEEADIILTMTKNHKKNLVTLAPDMADKIFALKEYVFDRERAANVKRKIEEAYNNMDEVNDEIQRQYKKTIRSLNMKRERLLEELEDVEAEILEKEREFAKKIKEARGSIFKLENEIDDIDITDPFGQPMEVYRETEKEITKALEKLIDFLENN
jgi:protein-tyrosine phosphatase